MIQSRQRFFTALFWGFFALRYFLLEARAPRCEVIDVFCPLDERIPFREGFLVFYVAWYILLIGMHLYTRKADSIVFLQYSRFLVFAFTLSSVCFLAFPSCQNLRPEVFQRDNVLTQLMAWFYTTDTSTNVCPSLHVAYSFGLASVWTKEKGVSRWWKAFVVVAVIFICLSTMFIKQHSAVDFFAALPVCLLAEVLLYGKDYWHPKFHKS